MHPLLAALPTKRKVRHHRRIQHCRSARLDRRAMTALALPAPGRFEASHQRSGVPHVWRVPVLHRGCHVRLRCRQLSVLQIVCGRADASVCWASRVSAHERQRTIQKKVGRSSAVRAETGGPVVRAVRRTRGSFIPREEARHVRKQPRPATCRRRRRRPSRRPNRLPPPRGAASAARLMAAQPAAPERRRSKRGPRVRARAVGRAGGGRSPGHATGERVLAYSCSKGSPWRLQL